MPQNDNSNLIQEIKIPDDVRSKIIKTEKGSRREKSIDFCSVGHRCRGRVKLFSGYIQHNLFIGLGNRVLPSNPYFCFSQSRC